MLNTNTLTNKKVFKRLPYHKLYLIFGILSILFISWTLIKHFIGWPSSVSDPSATEKVTDLTRYVGTADWFFYFTNLSNVLFAVVTTVRAFYRKKIWTDNLQIAVCSYMIVVGIVYWAAIFPFDIGSQSNDTTLIFSIWILDNILIHLTTVIFALIILFKTIRWEEVNTLKVTIKAVIFPLSYYIVAWIFYLITWFGISGNNTEAVIYDFLNFFHPYGIQGQGYAALLGIGFFIGILGIFLLCIFLPTFFSKKIARRHQLTSSKKEKIILPKIENIIKNQEDKTDSENEIDLDILKPTASVIQPEPILKNEKKPVKNEPTVEHKTPAVVKKRRVAVKKVAPKIEQPKEPIVNTKITKKRVNYIIQRSKKFNGWELKKVKGQRATYTAKRKSDVLNYYNTKIILPKGSILTEKDRYGKIRAVHKKK